MKEILKNTRGSVLLLGGSGFVGTPLSTYFLEAGWDITVFALTPPYAGEGKIKFIHGDRNVQSDLNQLKEHQFDVVIDLVPYLPEQTRAMTDLFAGRIQRFIHLSTIAVYNNYLEPVVNEDQVTRWPETSNGYAQSKAICEYCLEEAGEKVDFPYIILRASPVMGPKDSVSRENYFLKRILSGQPIVYPDLLNNYIVSLYVDDLIQAILRAVVAQKCIKKAYHIGFENVPTLKEHIENIACLAGKPNPVIKERPWSGLLNQGFRYSGFAYNPSIPWRLNIGRAIEELGFKPTSYEQALKETLDWLQANDPYRLPAWPGWSAMQTRLVGTHEFLHMDVETRYNGDHEPFWVDHPDSIFEYLSGLRKTGFGVALVKRVDWDYRKKSIDILEITAGERYQVVLVDDLSFQVLSGGSLENIRSINFSIDDCILAGAMEKAETNQDIKAAWLFSQLNPGLSQAYLHDKPVVLTKFIPFKKYESKEKVANKDRALLYLGDAGDCKYFKEWLLDKVNTGSFFVNDMESCVRTFIFNAGKCRSILNSNESKKDGESFENSIEGNTWLYTFDILRMLYLAGEESGGELKISTETCPVLLEKESVESQSKHPQDIVLCSYNDSFYLCKIKDKHVYKISDMMFLVLESFLYIQDESRHIEAVHAKWQKTMEECANIYASAKEKAKQLIKL